jgi:hypothetical protein
MVTGLGSCAETAFARVAHEAWNIGRLAGLTSRAHWVLPLASALFFKPLIAQSAPAAEPAHPARLVALAGAGAALVGEQAGRSLNPSLLSVGSRLGLAVGYAKVNVSDVVSMRAGAHLQLGHAGTISVDGRVRRVENIIDDPELAGEPGLAVGDRALRLSYARTFFHQRFGIGAALEHMSSEVFGTTGRGWAFSVGGILQLTPNLALGSALARLGREYEWTTLSGDHTYSPLGTGAVFGLRYTAAQSRTIAATMVVDAEVPLEVSAERGTRIGVEVSLYRALSLRVGYAAMRSARQAASDRYAAAGIGLTLRRARFDLARDRIGREIGERTTVQLTISQ